MNLSFLCLIPKKESNDRGYLLIGKSHASGCLLITQNHRLACSYVARAQPPKLTIGFIPDLLCTRAGHRFHRTGFKEASEAFQMNDWKNMNSQELMRAQEAGPDGTNCVSILKEEDGAFLCTIFWFPDTMTFPQKSHLLQAPFSQGARVCYLLCEYLLVTVHTTTNPSTHARRPLGTHNWWVHVLNLRFTSKPHPPPELLAVIKTVLVSPFSTLCLSGG